MSMAELNEALSGISGTLFWLYFFGFWVSAIWRFTSFAIASLASMAIMCIMVIEFALVNYLLTVSVLPFVVCTVYICLKLRKQRYLKD